MLISKRISIKIFIILLHTYLIKGNVEKACNNFYEYACSNYTQENPDGNYSEITQKLDYEMNKKLLKSLKYLEKRNSGGGGEKQNYEEKMLIYWQACRQEVEEIGKLKKYLEIIKPDKEVNWPLMETKGEWLEANMDMDIWPLLGEMQALGLNNILIQTEINRNEDNTLNIWLAPATKTEEDIKQMDENIIKIILKLLMIREDDFDNIIKQLKVTENKWLKAKGHYGYAHQIKQVDIEELTELYPQLNLKKFLTKLLGSHDGENISLITLENPKYFEFLNKKTWSHKEMEYFLNYLMFKYLVYMMQDRTKEFTEWSCLKDLKNKFDLSLNYLYYQDYFNFEPQRFRLYFDNLLYKIRATMLKIFEVNYLYLKPEQIDFIKNKLLNIKINLGNLPKNCNSAVNENYYQDLPNLWPENYYKNHLLLLKHRFSKSLLYSQNQTHFIVTSNQWGSNSSPFYIAQQNMIVLPFASFQLPFFQYLNTTLEQVPIFGFAFAHELTHAFDTSGLLYDHQGYPLAIPSDILLHTNFSKSLNCLQQQEPTNDIDERIADLFAVRVAYHTYVDYYAKGQRGWEQMFFRNLAQFFCGKGDLKFIDHDTDIVRLEQIVKNFQPFSLAFGCGEGNRMFKRNKCRLY